MSKEKLLVFGARKKSIGHTVAAMWRDITDMKVVTAGVNDDEDETLMDLESTVGLDRLFQEIKPTRVVVTTGVNFPRGEEEFEYWMYRHWHTNCYLPMHILMAWFEQEGDGYPPPGAHFAVMSSNSASIPRSQSMAYNSSKAGLSMAIRSAARDVGKAGLDMSVYGYELGLVKGTPMSAERGGTRMLGLPEGMSRRTVASHVVNNLLWGGKELNGCLLRLDAGEV